MFRQFPDKKLPLMILAIALAAASLLAINPLTAKENNQKDRRISSQVLALSKPSTPNPYLGLPTGVDVSYPRCKSGLNAPPGGFAIIGVTGGRAFTYNSCLTAEYSWAKRAKIPSSLYLNLNFPSGASADRGSEGPKGNCRADDIPCQAYNYGWNSAADAKAYADNKWISSKLWWADIETYNTWEFDGSLNARVIQGAIDFFSQQKINIGIYTAPRMWAAITDGDYDPKVPIWIAGAQSELEAHNYCGISIGSGPTWISQYGDGGPYDRDLVCH